MEIYITVIMAAAVCTLAGIGIVINNRTYITEGASKGASFGIITAYLSYFMPQNFFSPFAALLIIPYWAIAQDIAAFVLGFGSSCIALIVMHKLHKKNLISYESIGITIPAIIFSIGAVTGEISLYSENININSLIMGELVSAPFERIKFSGMDFGPIAIYIMGTALLFNIVCMINYYKTFRLASMDKEYAMSAKLPVEDIYKIIAIMVSISAASVLKITGVFMAAVFILAPVMTARLYTNRFFALPLLSLILCVFSSIYGIKAAKMLNIPIICTVSSLMGILFLISLLIAPKNGIIYNIVKKIKKRRI